MCGACGVRVLRVLHVSLVGEMGVCAGCVLSCHVLLYAVCCVRCLHGVGTLDASGYASSSSFVSKGSPCRWSSLSCCTSCAHSSGGDCHWGDLERILRGQPCPKEQCRALFD